MSYFEIQSWLLSICKVFRGPHVDKVFAKMCKLTSNGDKFLGRDEPYLGGKGRHTEKPIFAEVAQVNRDFAKLHKLTSKLHV